MAAYEDARTRWFAKFDAMKRGEVIVVAKVANGRPDLFISLCKEYIDDNPQYEFNSDYSKFRRVSVNF